MHQKPSARRDGGGERRHTLMHQELVLAAGAGATGAVLLTPASIWLARRIGAIAQPQEGDPTVHAKPMPRIGGLGISGAVVACAIVFLLPSIHQSSRASVAAIVAVFAILLSVAGLLDDLRRFSWRAKLLLEVAAGVALVGAGVHFSGPAALVCIPLSIFWVVGVTNAVNLIDGMDGLAAGTSAISAGAFSVIALSVGADNVAVLAAVLAGACLGFLVWNFYPSKTFMGDTGSLFIGFLLAAIPMALVGSAERLPICFAATICLALPIYDTLSSMVRRALHGKHILEGDMGHYYNQLISRLGMSQRSVALASYGICVVLAGIAISVAKQGLLTALLTTVVVYAVLAGAGWLGGFFAYEG